MGNVPSDAGVPRRSASITRADVDRACEQLGEDGVLEPSVRQVRKVLGRGSLTTISRHLGHRQEVAGPMGGAAAFDLSGVPEDETGRHIESILRKAIGAANRRHQSVVRQLTRRLEMTESKMERLEERYRKLEGQLGK